MLSLDLGWAVIEWWQLLLALMLFMMMLTQIRKSQQGISPFHPASIIATCGSIGRIKFMPGTLGSILAVLFSGWMAFLPRAELLDQVYLLPVFIGTTLAVALFGWWASAVYARKSGIDDPSEVIIDEVSGMMIAIMLTAFGFGLLMVGDTQVLYLLVWVPYYVLILFILFRILDIAKPWIIGKADKNIHGGLGIMADDWLAGVGAALIFLLVFITLFYTGMMHWLMAEIYPEWLGEAPPERVY